MQNSKGNEIKMKTTKITICEIKFRVIKEQLIQMVDIEQS